YGCWVSPLTRFVGLRHVQRSVERIIADWNLSKGPELNSLESKIARCSGLWVFACNFIHGNGSSGAGFRYIIGRRTPEIGLARLRSFFSFDDVVEILLYALVFVRSLRCTAGRSCLLAGEQRIQGDPALVSFPPVLIVNVDLGLTTPFTDIMNSL